jgi:hypothetical protein
MPTREAIFMRIKKEDSGDNGTFETTVRTYITNPKYAKYFWVSPLATLAGC